MYLALQTNGNNRYQESNWKSCKTTWHAENQYFYVTFYKHVLQLNQYTVPLENVFAVPWKAFYQTGFIIWEPGSKFTRSSITKTEWGACMIFLSQAVGQIIENSIGRSSLLDMKGSIKTCSHHGTLLYWPSLNIFCLVPSNFRAKLFHAFSSFFTISTMFHV